MKLIEKEQCRQLRIEGKSIKEIAKIVKVSPGSVSRWVKDIILTNAQQQILIAQNPAFSKMSIESINKSKKYFQERSNWYKNLRQSYQNEGRKKAREKRPLHLSGCMLYWAEGNKSQNRMSFSNSDVDMMKLFVDFLRKEMGLTNDKILFSVNVHLTNNLSINDIYDYWLKHLGLENSCLRKATISNIPISSASKKKNKLIYGVGRIQVYDVKVVQHIYGAIQEYANIPFEKWLTSNQT